MKRQKNTLSSLPRRYSGLVALTARIDLNFVELVRSPSMSEARRQDRPLSGGSREISPESCAINSVCFVLSRLPLLFAGSHSRDRINAPRSSSLPCFTWQSALSAVAVRSTYIRERSMSTNFMSATAADWLQNGSTKDISSSGCRTCKAPNLNNLFLFEIPKLHEALCSSSNKER